MRTASGNIKSGGTLSAIGATTLDGKLFIGDTSNANTVGGSASIRTMGGLAVTLKTVIGGTLSVKSATTLTDVDAGGNLDVAGTGSVQGTLAVDGVVTLNGTTPLPDPYWGTSCASNLPTHPSSLPQMR